MVTRFEHLIRAAYQAISHIKNQNLQFFLDIKVHKTTKNWSKMFTKFNKQYGEEQHVCST